MLSSKALTQQHTHTLFEYRRVGAVEEEKEVADGVVRCVVELRGGEERRGKVR